MRKVAVMTDTVASVPLKIQKEYGIGVIPFHIIMDDKDYLETEINMNYLYTRLKDKENLPTTSFSSSEEYLQFYRKLSQNAEAILHISVTAAFSGAYKAALQAREMAKKKLPKTTIEVIDSKTVEGPQFFLTLEAARAAAQGRNLDEVKQLVTNMIPRLNEFSTRDTLFYLDKGGRVCEAKLWAEAEASSSFRAIVGIDASTGGITKPIARAKTRSQIMDKLVDITRERAGDKKLHFAIAHANIPEQAEQLKQKILSSFQCEEFYILEIPPVVAIHNGEGLIDCGFYGTD